VPNVDMTKISVGARVVEQLAQMSPIAERVLNALDIEDDGQGVCIFCLVDTAEEESHAEDCIWRMAREVFPQS
jgi:hypothetical protein